MGAAGLSGCGRGKTLPPVMPFFSLEGGRRVYSVDLYRRIRLACRHDGMSQRKAARHFDVSRDFVKKALAHSVPPGYQRSAPPKRPKLDPCTGIIDHILEADEYVERRENIIALGPSSCSRCSPSATNRASRG